MISNVTVYKGVNLVGLGRGRGAGPAADKPLDTPPETGAGNAHRRKQL